MYCAVSSLYLCYRSLSLSLSHQIFALEYYRFNKDRVIKSEDAAYILSFAIMMLHTALHNPSVKNRTTKKQWVSMNRGEGELGGGRLGVGASCQYLRSDVLSS